MISRSLTYWGTETARPRETWKSAPLWATAGSHLRPPADRTAPRSDSATSGEFHCCPSTFLHPAIHSKQTGGNAFAPYPKPVENSSGVESAGRTAPDRHRFHRTPAGTEPGFFLPKFHAGFPDRWPFVLLVRRRPAPEE